MGLYEDTQAYNGCLSTEKIRKYPSLQPLLSHASLPLPLLRFASLSLPFSPSPIFPPPSPQPLRFLRSPLPIRFLHPPLPPRRRRILSLFAASLSLSRCRLSLPRGGRWQAAPAGSSPSRGGHRVGLTTQADAVASQRRQNPHSSPARPENPHSSPPRAGLALPRPDLTPPPSPTLVPAPPTTRGSISDAIVLDLAPSRPDRGGAAPVASRRRSWRRRRRSRRSPSRPLSPPTRSSVPHRCRWPLSLPLSPFAGGHEGWKGKFFGGNGVHR